MDSSTYGSMVEHGGYATGGIASTSTTKLIDAGFTPASATGEMRLLRHSGVVSIQLQRPGTRDPDDGCAGVPARV
jgi:hypothetical protein